MRTTSKRVTLQNIYNTLVYLTKQNKLSELSKLLKSTFLNVILDIVHKR